MKYGFIWFLHLDTPLQIARIAVIPCFLNGFFARIGSLSFFLSWAFFLISLLITLCTFFMHIPSTEKVEKFIFQYEKDFLERQKTEFRSHKNVEVLELKCFAANKGIRMSRKISERRIFDTLVLFAWVETQEGLWLAYDEKPLWTDAPADKQCYEIKNPEEIKITKTVADIGEIKLSFEIDGDSFYVSCRDDYHFRDFVNKYGIAIIE